MRYLTLVLLVLIELVMTTGCGAPTVHIDPTVNVTDGSDKVPQDVVTPGVTIVSTLTCSGHNVSYRSSPAITITFSYQETIYSDDHKQVTCSMTSTVPHNNSQTSASDSRLLNKTDNDYNTGLCIAYADIDLSSGHWNFTNDQKIIYSGTAQTTMGGIFDMAFYCH